MDQYCLKEGVHFYVILDTNWLLNNSCTNITFPRAVRYRNSILPWRNGKMVVSRIFPVEIIIPTQVKSELAKLHGEQVDHKKTANGKRHYSKLQSFFYKEVCRYYDSYPYPGYDFIYDGYDYLHREYTYNLLTCSEVDLNRVSNVVLREPVIGPDSFVDKGIVSLAHHICKESEFNHCFIASVDTGIQAEVSNLFYRENIRIGTPNIIDDWLLSVRGTAKILADKSDTGSNTYGKGEWR